MWNQTEFATWQATWTTLSFRLPMIWMQAIRPTPEGEKEMTRMVAEKQQAFVDGVIAAQRKWVDEWFALWLRPFAKVAPQTVATRVTQAALAPARRTVKANAKRLRKL